MKRYLFQAATLTLLLAATARADLVITQQISTTGSAPIPQTESIIKVKGDKLRMDMGEQMSTIIDGASGDITTLLHPQKMFMVIPAAAVQAMSSQMAAASKFGEEQKDAAPELTKTGKTEEINGMKAEEYTVETQGSKMHLWLTNELPNAQQLLESMAKFNKVAQQAQPGGIDYEKLPGFPIKSVIEMPGGGTIETTVTDIEETEVPATDFDPPSGYKKLEAPAAGQ